MHSMKQFYARLRRGLRGFSWTSSGVPLIVVVVCVSICACEAPKNNSCEIPGSFYTYEGNMVDPLILEGHCVVPAVIVAIENRSMLRRRVAIRYLGNERTKEALPVLLRLLRDDSDPDRD